MWDWFIPIIPPNRALSEAISKTNVVLEFSRKNARIVNGASFCHVDKIIQENHEIDVITEGNQKWNGAIPSFNMIAVISIMFI